MKRSALLPILLAAACQPQDAMTNNGVPTSAAAAPGEPAPATSATPAQAVQTATLTGLYESGAPGHRSQMCVIEGGAQGTRFGIVHWGAGSESCSGDGTIARQGDVLRLTMAGDEPCTIEARIEGGRVSFPPTLPAGCAYYCSRGARFAGASFDKTGGTAQDAMRAEDLAGDRLCAGSAR
jgi:hypothetical protein